MTALQIMVTVTSPYDKQSCDPQWSSVKYFIGGASMSPVESKAGLSVSQSGDLSVQAQNPVGEGNSLRFNGGSYLQFANNPAEDLGGNDFTIEAFVKFDKRGSYTVISKDNPVNVAYGAYQIVASGNGTFNFYVSTTGNGWAISNSWGQYTAGIWTQVAITRQGNVWRFFQDGILQNSVSVAGSIITRGLGMQVGAGRQGDFNSGTLYYPTVGNIQGIRVSNIARYTGNYTPTGIAGGACP